MLISEIITQLEILAPPVSAEHYDNIGLLVGTTGRECSAVLIALDATEAVVEEAIEKKCNLLITHHPVIFRGLKRINGLQDGERAIIAAIKNDIAIYAIHTNLDNVIHGVNAAIADKIGLVNRSFLLPRDQVTGSGLCGSLRDPLSERDFLQLLKEKFGIPAIRHTRLTGRMVNRVALCGGAGSFLIANALEKNTDFFVSADIKYHDFFEANGQMVIADIGHYESEQFTTGLLYDALLEKFPTFAVLKAGTLTNPVHYYL